MLMMSPIDVTIDKGEIVNINYSPEVLADRLAGNLQDDHGWVQLSESLDGRDVNREDVRCVNA